MPMMVSPAKVDGVYSYLKTINDTTTCRAHFKRLGRKRVRAQAKRDMQNEPRETTLLTRESKPRFYLPLTGLRWEERRLIRDKHDIYFD